MRYSLILLVLAGLFIGFALSSQPASNAKARIFTIEDLPVGAESVEHAHETAEAEEAEQISMKHYATPEALGKGGPIFGAIGYRVISVEYEFRATDIPHKTVGQEFPGYLLNIPGYENMNYDHFHISSHDAESGEIEYSAHFMLIPHEEELGLGLVCE